MKKYQLTCQIDGDLIGPLTELIAPYGRVSVKLVDAPETPKAPSSPPRMVIRRRHKAFNTGRGTGPIAALRILATATGPRNVREVKAAILSTGSSPNGSGAILTKLKRKGYVRWVSDGMWAATPKGEAFIAKLDRGEAKEGEHEPSA